MSRYAWRAPAWVNIDEGLGASLHGTEHVTAPLAYLRLHGRNYKNWFSSKNHDEPPGCGSVPD
ncbi:MAG TPA: hypothetical protein VGM27_17350 [Acidobacteriaceae bacterium]